MAYQLSKAEKDLMVKIKENNKHVCYYCGKNIIDPDDLTVDHKIPVARGGQTVEFNLVISCKNCNLTKSNLNESEYRSILNEAIELMKTTKLYDIILFNNSLESAMEFKKLQISKKSEYQKAIECEKNNLIELTRQLVLNPNKDLKINKKMVNLIKRIDMIKLNMEKNNFIESLATKVINYIKDNNTPDEIYNKILHLLVNKIRLEYLEEEEEKEKEKEIG